MLVRCKSTARKYALIDFGCHEVTKYKLKKGNKRYKGQRRREGSRETKGTQREGQRLRLRRFIAKQLRKNSNF
jgi:hypothetical protein